MKYLPLFIVEDEEKELIHFLYSIGLKKYDKPKDLKVPKSLEKSLSGNLSLEVAMAERHFYNCDYPASHQASTKVMKKDPFHEGCLPIHISCLIELRKPNGKFLQSEFDLKTQERCFYHLLFLCV